jgi:hypothetical protein
MNELIKDLAKQAKEYARGFNHQHDVFEKKFAELIINECYNRAEGQYHHSSDEWDKGVMAVMNSIDELFSE